MEITRTLRPAQSAPNSGHATDGDAPRPDNLRRSARRCDTTRWPAPGSDPLGQPQGQQGDEGEQGQQDRGGAGDRQVRPLALHFQPQMGSASSKVTSTDQRMMTQCRICCGVAWRSIQKNASMRSLPSGSHTSTERISTGGKPGVHHSAVCEKTHRVLHCPLYQCPATVSQVVSLRLAQACKLHWRFPFKGLGPRLPGGRGHGR